jgi:hypothetical protein
LADRTLVMASTAILIISMLFLVFLLYPSIPQPNTPNVQLSNDKWTYESGETMRTTITNTGTDSCGFGYGFGFSRKLFNLWITPIGGPVQGPIIAIGLMLNPGASFSESVSLGGVWPGVYRVWKNVGQGFAYAEFTVEGRDPIPYVMASVLLIEFTFLFVALMLPERRSAGQPSYEPVRRARYLGSQEFDALACAIY